MPRNKVSLVLLLTALLAACAAPASPASPTSPAASTASPTSAPATAASQPLVIQHSLGETTVNAPAQRVVALEWTYVEDLLALGIQPVGIADIEGFKDWVKVPVELSPETVDVGFRGEPNLETLSTLHPDLIIDIDYSAVAYYDQLSAIAPSLVFNPYPADESLSQYAEMRQTFLTIADATGRRAEGEAVLARFDQKLVDSKAQIDAAGRSGEKVVLVQGFGGDEAQVRLFTDNSMAVQIVEQLGLGNGWDGAFDPYGFTSLSLETLPDLGDVNFFYVVQNDDNVFAGEAYLPVWNSLEFVKAGHAYPLGGDTWLFGGPLSGELLVDLVTRALTNDAP